MMGVWAGLLIGYFTEFMTSHSYSPVREVAHACATGTATNIIYGLALGYLSTIVPILAIGVTAYVSSKMLDFYGVALAALGMLSNLTIGLAIDGYGPISDNAGGIAEMAELGAHVRERTDALDAAGNTTAAIGKGFAIGSAALVSLSLYGGFVTRAQNTKHGLVLDDASIMNPMIYASLLIGAMLPYAFSAMTMKSVGLAALEMVVEVRRQLKENPGIYEGTHEPDYQACIKISTRASLREMVAPGMLVILTPILIGLFFGPQAIAGLLPGALVSGVQMAISSSNTGGAWDNAKKYIESGQYIDENGEVKKKGSDEHKAAVIGDTVGDPLKDTSGPSLNILIKLMAILSLVLAEFFCQTGWIERKLNDTV
jgi:inorganic pyrophosphatase